LRIRLEDRSDEELLSEALAGRSGRVAPERGEAAWGMLVAKNRSRVRIWVKAFRHPDAPSVRIPESDVEDVAQAVWKRATERLYERFRGADVNTFRSALRSVTDFQCKDACRKRLRGDKRRAGSLDESAFDEGEETCDRGRYDGDLAKRAAQEQEISESTSSRQEALHRAIGRLGSELQQLVLRDTIEGLSSKEIAERRHLSVSAVDQHRSRGMRKLAQDDDLRDDIYD
jgi:RNA polymerase sigma factor (sigma-70 family)